GNLVAIKDVTDENDLMIITKNGITIRIPVEDLRVMGRATQGVRLIKLDEEDAIASVGKVEHEKEIDEIVEAEGDSPESGTTIENSTEENPEA
ncbi:MAG TPA: DNA gyrase C-terminal beta-propeller domain-containing protein, partial [Bacteroidia bacterium]|nr:DNA gyrase C-terminal beta-propeller domain-containing protein [Bacteroidia bacterium]